MKKLLFALVLSCAVLGAYGVGRAQTSASQVQADKKEAIDYAVMGSQAKIQNSYDLAEKMSASLLHAPKNPQLTKDMITAALYDGVDDNASKQRAFMMAQNARIIELLEQLNKKGAH